MNLLVLMYHRSQAGRHGNPVEMLDAHFEHLARHHVNVLPGERLKRDRLNVCLTFDDGYFDFHARVFPLLRKHGLRAVLAVPPNFIRDEVSTSTEQRVSLEAETAFADPASGGFCTWSELKEMARSGQVSIAAHGSTHVRLDEPDADLPAEIDYPQQMLEKKLGHAVESFVLPYGRYSRRAVARAMRRYRHVFRIGGAINDSWNGLLYRVDADAMESPHALLTPPRLAAYRVRRVWNRLRGR